MRLSGEETKWIAIGELHNWFSEAGCEIEVGRTGQISDQQDGLRWPAFYSVQDNQAGKAMWIGAENYFDPIVDKSYNHKVVHVGPRFIDVKNETMPVEFTLKGKYDHPNVLVDGDPSTNMQYMDVVDEVDPNLPADRVLTNVMQTSMGVQMNRKIYAFSHQDHQNYFIYEYVFTNNGIYDKDGNIYSQTLEGFQVFFQYRYAINREGAVYDGNWLPQSAAWGHNTMNDVIGEDSENTKGNDQYYDDGELMRAQYSWHGYHSKADFDNIGAPNVRGDGHLGGAQFVGSVTLHADKSSSDSSDDLNQPSTTWYVFSDDPLTDAGTDQFNSSRMSDEYDYMTRGHPEKTQAENVGATFPDLFSPGGISNPGGASHGQGFGPYTLAPGDSVRIVIAEAADGLSREMCYEIGGNWKNSANLDLPTNTPIIDWMTDKYLSSGISDADKYKNQWVFTGLDSLISTFKRARENFKSNFALASPPQPPALFEVNSGGDRISLSWSSESENTSGLSGYKITRLKFVPDTSGFIYSADIGSIIVDTTIIKSWTINPGTLTFDDYSAQRGFDYYYYLEAFDDGNQNNSIPLYSSRFFARTNKPAYLKRPPGESLSDIRVVPNPFNLSARDIQYGISASDRLMFLNIPPECTIRIFTERGDLLNTIIHTDGSGDEAWNSVTSSRQVIVSGLYIAHFETPLGESTLRKFIVVR
jgi:hypothetical protein